MELADTIDFTVVREGCYLLALFSGVPLLVCMVVGIVVSVLQAVTQIQEQTLSFIPKVGVVVAILVFGGPWAMAELTRYLSSVLLSLPEISRTFGGGG